MHEDRANKANPGAAPQVRNDRRQFDAALQAIEERLVSGTQRMDAIETAMRSNTAMVQEVLDIMSTAKAGLRALGWLGTGVRWLGGVAAACAALWALYQSIRNGAPPPHQ